MSPGRETTPFSHRAMGTEFGLLLPAELEAGQQRALAELAFEEVDRLERLLSRFDPRSEVSLVNAAAPREQVTIGPDLLCLLQQCQVLNQWTARAFDVLAAPGRECPARLVLDVRRRTVSLTEPGTRVDLGAIGKGYAVDRVAALLREEGVERALIHAGTSTLCALGGAFPVGIADPRRPEVALARLALRGMALSTSNAVGDPGHLLDPASGLPASAVLSASVLHPSPTTADALSTAICVAGLSLAERLVTEDGRLGVILLGARETGGSPPELKVLGRPAENAFQRGQWR